MRESVSTTPTTIRVSVPLPIKAREKPESSTIIIVVAIIGVAIFFALQNWNEGKVNGEYITQTAISDNLINFSSNGGFARFARHLAIGNWWPAANTP